MRQTKQGIAQVCMPKFIFLYSHSCSWPGGGIRMEFKNFEKISLSSLDFRTTVIKVSSVKSKILFWWDTLWKVVVDKYWCYGICGLIWYRESFWPSCKMIKDCKDVSVSWGWCFTFSYQICGNFVERPVWYLSSTVGMTELQLFLYNTVCC